MKKLVFAFLLLFLATPCWAVTNDWIAAGAGNWSTAANWSQGHKPAAGEDITMGGTSDQNCVIDEATANLNSFDMTGYTGELSGTKTLNIVGSAGATNNCIFAGTITWTGTLLFSPASTAIINFTTNGKMFQSVYIGGNSGISTIVLQDNLSFAASKTTSLTIAASNSLDLNGKTISGNSSTNRVLIATVSLGSQRIITVNGGTFANADFRDITATNSGTIDSVANNGGTARFSTNGIAHGMLAGDSVTIAGTTNYNGIKVITNVSDTTHFDTADAYVSSQAGTWTGNLNLSTATGGSGNCGGNTGITFTTADIWYYHNSDTTNRNWSDYAQWYETTNGVTQMASTRVVLPQDDAIFDINSFAHGHSHVAADMPRLCQNIDWSGATNTPQWDIDISCTMYGSLDMTNIVYDFDAGFTFEGRGDHTINTPSTAWQITSSVNIASVGGSYQLLSDLTLNQGGSSRVLYLLNGTFDANDFDITCGIFNSNNSSVRKLQLGNGTWTVKNSSSATTVWNINPSNLDVTSFAEGSTIVLNQTDGYAVENFNGGSLVYNNLTIESDSITVTTIVGSNIFNTFTINAPKTVKFTASTNTTVNSLVATGTLGNKITLASVTPGSWWQITDADGGTNINDYLDVTDSHGHPDSTFYYGANGSGDAYSIANGWGISATTRRIYMFN